MTQRAPGDDTQQPRQDPHDLPARGWLAALKRAKPRLKELNIPLLAAGVAFWAMLSLFPALIALVVVYGLVSSPEQVTTQVGNALGAVSQDAKGVITGQLETVAAGKAGALSFGLLASLLGLLWSASSGMQNLMQALSTAHEQKETRGFVKLRGTALALTLGALLFAVLVLAAIGVVPPLLENLLGSGPLRILLVVVQFALLFALVVGALAVLYRFGPANRPVGWRWASSGAVVGGVLWMVGTVAFALYVNNFSSYSNTYGALAGVVIFMLWLYLSAFVVLFGALVNAEAEREAKGDAEAEPEGVDRDVVRAPDEEAQEARLRRPAPTRG